MSSSSSSESKPKKSVLFVCLGNICRSPIAEAVFTQRLRQRGVDEGKWQVQKGAPLGYCTIYAHMFKSQLSGLS